MKNEFESFYLSDPDNVPRALELTGLALDELEDIVGYFTKTSHRAGQMRGEVVCGWKGITIRHHFTKKVLWRSDETTSSSYEAQVGDQESCDLDWFERLV